MSLATAIPPSSAITSSNDVTSLLPKKGSRARPLFDPPIVKRAIVDSFRKLNPRLMMKNPVMFVVEVGAAMTTVLAVRDVAQGAAIAGFTFQITLWLWFTVLFANFAEAMAEGRGKAQADTLRKTKTETTARRLLNGANRNRAGHACCARGDVVLVELGETIPGDGDVIEGIASVDESRHHRRKRARDPRIRRRPQRRHRRHQGALRLDQSQDHLQPRRNFSGPHDRAGGRRRAAEDAQRNRAQHRDRRPDPHLPAGGGHAAAVRPYSVKRPAAARAHRSRC